MTTSFSKVEGGRGLDLPGLVTLAWEREKKRGRNLYALGRWLTQLPVCTLHM